MGDQKIFVVIRFLLQISNNKYVVENVFSVLFFFFFFVSSNGLLLFKVCYQYHGTIRIS